MQPILIKKLFLLSLIITTLHLITACRSISITEKDMISITNLKQDKIQKRDLPVLKQEPEDEAGEEPVYISRELPVSSPLERVFPVLEPVPERKEDLFFYGYVPPKTPEIAAEENHAEPSFFYKKETREIDSFESLSQEMLTTNLQSFVPLWVEPPFNIPRVVKNEGKSAETEPVITRLSQTAPAEIATGSAALPPAPENLRTETRLIGGIVEVLLPGLGWIYLGQREGPSPLRYRERNYSGDNTVFQFSTDKPGNYKLNFQKQETGRGSSRLLILDLNVILDTDPATSPEPALQTVGRITASQAEELLKAGKKQEALYAYLQGHEEKDLVVQERIASLARDLGEYQISAASWKRIYSQVKVPEDARRAVSGYLIAIIKGNLSPEISAEEIIKNLGATDLELLLQTAQYLEGVENTPEAVKIYEYLLTLKGTLEKDKLLYRIATLFERDSRIRDEKKAILYYEQLVENYPISPYWQYAKERITHLNRYYFHIR